MESGVHADMPLPTYLGQVQEQQNKLLTHIRVSV
jgi:hypothetical protein